MSEEVLQAKLDAIHAVVHVGSVVKITVSDDESIVAVTRMQERLRAVDRMFHLSESESRS